MKKSKKVKSRRIKTLINVILVACFFAWVIFAALWVILVPDREYSENEKRYLSSAPVLSWDSVMNGKYTQGIEDWMNDQFPARESWAGLNAALEQMLGMNGKSGVYLCSDGSLIRSPAADNASVTNTAASKISAFAEATGLPVRFMLVPSAGYIREDALPKNHEAYHDAEIIARTQAALDERVEWIDMTAVLSPHKDEGIYFDTDHHWTSLGAYYGYEAYCEAVGLTPVAQDAFQVETVSNFMGTNWSTACLWYLPGDEMEIWTDPSLRVTTSISEPAKEPVVQEGMLFRNRLSEMDKYTVFLDGNHSLVTIDNPASDGGVLLILKDSYGHIFTPFLASHYSKIIMVDMRYYKQSMTELCQAEGVTDVLVLYSVGTFVEASDLAFLR